MAYSYSRQETVVVDDVPFHSNEIFIHKGMPFVVNPNVFDPHKNNSSVFFADNLIAQRPAGDSFIEIGSGCGLVGLTIAKTCGLSLTATDINPFAVACTLENSSRLGIADRVSAHHSDVFDAVPLQKVDTIFWNAPWISNMRLKGQEELTRVQRSFYDPGYQALEKYISSAEDYLVQKGKLYLGFGRGADTNGMFLIARKHGYEPTVIAKELDGEKTNINKFVLYHLRRPVRRRTSMTRTQPLLQRGAAPL